MARAAKFDWDDANTGHIARHSVTPEVVEQAFANHPLVVLATRKRGGESRVLCAGLTAPVERYSSSTRCGAAGFA